MSVSGESGPNDRLEPRPLHRDFDESRFSPHRASADATRSSNTRLLIQQTIPLISDYTGMKLPSNLEMVYAFDRVDWIEANVDAFKIMFEPIERLGNSASLPGRLGELWNGVNQTVLSAEIGFMLGYLARRVLGQYDLALLGREPLASSGKLYFVQPNIAGVERSLGIPADQFRLWLALHEATHAFEFECNPWVRTAMNDLLERYFSLLTDDVEYLQRGTEAIKMFWERARSSSPDTRFVDRAGHEQRATAAVFGNAGPDGSHRGLFQPHHERRGP